MSGKERTVFVCSIDCPHCHGSINVLKKTRMIAPAVKAEKEEKYIAEKGAQTRLFGDEKP